MSDADVDGDEVIDYETMCGDVCVERSVGEASSASEEGEIAGGGDDAGGTRARVGRLPPSEATMMDALDPGRIDLAEKDLIVAERVRRAIEEPKGHLLRALAKRFGGDALERCLRETTRVMREGGADYEYEEGCVGSGVWRKRTRAGCFLMVFKRSHDAAEVEAALAESRDIDRALKRLRRERESGRGRGRGRR